MPSQTSALRPTLADEPDPGVVEGGEPPAVGGALGGERLARASIWPLSAVSLVTATPLVPGVATTSRTSGVVVGRLMCSGRERALMARMTKVEMFAAIRRDSRIEGMSIRALADKYGVHRRMVREALASVWPKPRKRPPPRKSRLDPFKPSPTPPLCCHCRPAHLQCHHHRDRHRLLPARQDSSPASRTPGLTRRPSYVRSSPHGAHRRLRRARPAQPLARRRR